MTCYLCLQYSEVIPNQVDLSTYLTKKIRSEYSDDECWYGHSYRTPNGNRNGYDRAVLVSFIRICLVRSSGRRSRQG